MRLHIHDFSGHPFQVELSRALAQRGHDVLHTYCAEYVTGRGRLQLGPEDPPNLRIEAVSATHPIVKYSPVGRARWELSYAAALQRLLDRERSDVFVCCNAPLFSLARLRRYLARTDQRWVLWHQDMYSQAMGDELARRIPERLARLARRALTTTEKNVVKSANSVVAIAEPFRRRYQDWGLATDHVQVIPNWAPIEEITPQPRDTAWSARLAPAPFRLVYAGTLGRKHNPQLLIDLIDRLRATDVMAQLVIISEGVGAQIAADAAVSRPHVTVMGYQEPHDLPSVLASADVLVALLEPSASQFSVPSKVASYLAAGRPVLLLSPPDNPAAAHVRAAEGFVGSPDARGVADSVGWLAELAADPRRRALVGRRARATAETNYDIHLITDTFESALCDVHSPGVAVR